MVKIDETFPVGEDGFRIDPDTLDEADNKKIHFARFRAFTDQHYGYLGKGNRVKLGSCVENKIKKLFPSESEEYLGFRPSSAVEETDNGSF